MNIKKQIKRMYLYEAMSCFRIMDAVWVLFLLGRGYSLAEVGIAEGIFHLTSMICEIPSGMAADLMGRKRTLAVSCIAGILSCLFMGMDGWRGWIYPGMIFSALQCNLISGTEEALLYDSLLQENATEKYREVRSRMNITGSVARAASCAFSPVSILMGYQKTYLICAVVDAVSLLTVHGMQEARVTVNQKTSRENPFEQIGKRMKEHVIETLKFIRKHPVTMCKLLADAAIACPCYLTMMYLQEHLVSNGWPESLIGLPILLIPLSGAAGSWMASRICGGLFGIVVICGIVGGIGTCLAGSSILAVSMAGGCLAWIVSGYAEIVVGENVNRDFTSDQRATMVSVDSMIYSVLMVIVSPLTGYAGSHMSVSVSFYLMGAGLIGLTCILCALYRICSKFSLR